MSKAQENTNQRGQSVGIKETISNLVIAFMLAFLFRGFVIEGFQIPTGSMAPTLLGKHVQLKSPYNGYEWSVGPWDYADRSRSIPVRNQSELKVNDPISALEMTESNRRLAAGDRVFVLKYLPFLQQPQRWDVVVFKNPGTHENYIKRLIGMPGEQLALVDGDVFTRPSDDINNTKTQEEQGWIAWSEDNWSIQRKPERIQRTMFQDVFNSKFVPEGELTYRSPLNAMGAGWSVEGMGKGYTHSGSKPSTLVWNGTRSITDFNAYNQTHGNVKPFADPSGPQAGNFPMPYPSSDVALSLNIRSSGDPVRVSPILEARGMQFRATIAEDSGMGSANVQMRKSPEEEWITLDSGSFDSMGNHQWHTIEFWHVDQALWLFIDQELICGGIKDGAYELSPAQRAVAATGQHWGQLAANRDFGNGVDYRSPSVFSDSSIYRKATFRWDFSGGDFEVKQVAVQRDIAYHINKSTATRGAHPNNSPTTDHDEYFMCGDNSSNSLDSRLWAEGSVNPWVDQEINDRVGMVHRDLIVGRAFVVYFPAPLDQGPILAPDFGRLRWIW